MKHSRRLLGVLLGLVMVLSAAGISVFAAAQGSQYKPGTYTVTANLYIDGSDNQILKGTTAYLTNTAFPPTSPVTNNATLTVHEDGTMDLTISKLNSIVRLQSVGGGQGAEVLSARMAGSGQDRHMEGLTVRLQNDSGSYYFAQADEKPSVVNQEYKMPLHLSVDLSSVPKGVSAQAGASSVSEEPAETRPAAEAETVPEKSLPANPVAAVRQQAVHVVTTIAEHVEHFFQKILNLIQGPAAEQRAAQQQTSEQPTEAAVPEPAVPVKNTSAKSPAAPSRSKSVPRKQHSTVTASKSNKGAAKVQSIAPGTYRVSANLWFSSGTTGLPMNPHLTNGSFPPSEPVSGNAVLTVKPDGHAYVQVPIAIQSKIMNVRAIHGLPIAAQTKSGGGIRSITVDLGKLSAGQGSVRRSFTADIAMGDLAMQISGMSRNHTWPGTFEMDFKGLPNSGGGALSAKQAAELQSAAKNTKQGGKKDPKGRTVISGHGRKQRADGDASHSSNHAGAWTGGSIGAAAVLAAAIYWIHRKRG